MLQFKESKGISFFVSEQKKLGKTIGFVPTMGALHDGHLSLIGIAKKTCDIVISSIFINPTQFNNANDLKNYPIDIENDLKLLSRAECDAVFIPTVTEMYHGDLSTITLDLDGADKYLEGEHRPGHFQGVITIVNKFFDIIKPHKAFFGQKDFQQYAIIKKMSIVLNHDIEVVMCPTIRESNGLAMSSRNRLLKNEEREKAAIIYRALNNAVQQSAKKDVHELLEQIKNELSQEKTLSIDYVEIADVETLQPIRSWGERKEAQAFIAAFLGKVRLIDNITLIR